jgi:hypothetical protein
MRKLLVLPALVAAIAVGVTVAAPAAPAATNGVVLPVGCSNPTTGALCTVTLTGFTVVNGTLQAVLQVTDTATGTLLGTITAPVGGQAGGRCTILDLTVGPINLDLLGLVVQTNTIHLQITAQQGPGNLLGNLLCGLANALNGGGSLTQISNILNQLLNLGLLQAVP